MSSGATNIAVAPTTGENAWPSIARKHAIVTAVVEASAKLSRGNWAREGAECGDVAGNKGSGATARELAAETNRRIVPLAPMSPSKEQVDRMVAEAAQNWAACTSWFNSGSRQGARPPDRPDRNRHRRGFDRGFQREVCRGATLLPRGHPVHEDGRLGPHHQHQRRQRPQRRPISATARAMPAGAHDKNAGSSSGPSCDHGQLHPPRHDRTERRPSLLAARATQLGVSPEEAERQDFAPDSPRGNSICRMVDARRSRSSRLPGLG